ncbi:hypothetical protein [Actinocrispum wychmicini]|uniref:Uncharacterized protein n=1 Tax=Actinocrispum wychmicini TaxID=1213861 RepID=A0A4R2JWZ4_9PSEU|nr:hypothetical protein [Actinocrispum wychmicini]TCO65013.1 hypothetical protein EV192_101797 [Actinocrispum wychmicini]
MSDDIRDLLNTAFTNEPPLRFERTAVITRGRRVIRKRWMMAAGSAVISVIVLTGGILLVAGLQQGSSAPLQPGTAKTCLTPSPSGERGGSSSACPSSDANWNNSWPGIIPSDDLSGSDHSTDDNSAPPS